MVDETREEEVKKKELEPLTMEDLAGLFGYILTGVMPSNWKGEKT